MKKLFCLLGINVEPALSQKLQDFGLLFLRLSVGGLMLVCHGWGKLLAYPEKYASFPDPLGVSPPVSMALAIGAEVFCSIAIILGFATRAAAIPLIITMFVAAFIIHADDPWNKKEFALMYLIPFATLLFTGPGKHSIDARLSKGCAKDA